jgi:hypothetical protein
MRRRILVYQKAMRTNLVCLQMISITRPLFFALVLGLSAASNCTAESPVSEPPMTPGFKRVIPIGMLVHAPAIQPACSVRPVSYELGSCFQLDKTHCMLVSNMDEQGGPDLCIGNDAFVFEKLSEIKAEKAIIINRSETNYYSPGREGASFLAKYPVSGFFVPRGALLADGKPHPGAGSGLLMSICVAYASDRSDPTTAGKAESNWKSWDTVVEFIQVRWDGKKLQVSEPVKTRQILGQKFIDSPFGQLSPLDLGFVGACQLESNTLHAVRFDWDGRKWAPTRVGPRFTQTDKEFEPTIQHQGNRYLISTRDDKIPKVRIYSSEDGLDYKFLFESPNHYVPRALNKGLDGSIYLATNPGPGFLRNPLLAYPLTDNAFGEPTIIHDQDGIRSDKGDTIPFVDHGQAANVFLEGRWRHLIFFRVCDLKERTLYGFQKSFVKHLQGDKGPIPKRPTSGAYVAELEYEKVTAVPYRFAEK